MGVGRSKKSDWLLGTVVEDVKVFFLKTLHELAVRVDDAGIDFDQRNANLQRPLRRGRG